MDGWTEAIGRAAALLEVQASELAGVLEGALIDGESVLGLEMAGFRDLVARELPAARLANTRAALAALITRNWAAAR